MGGGVKIFPWDFDVGENALNFLILSLVKITLPS